MCICIYGKSSRFVSTVTTIMANVDLFIRNQRAKLDSERAEFTSETSNRERDSERRRAPSKPNALSYASEGPRKESSPAETGLKLGQYEDKQKLLREERKKEYQQYLAKNEKGSRKFQKENEYREKDDVYEERQTLREKRQRELAQPQRRRQWRDEDMDDYYADMLRRKREEENRYRSRKFETARPRRRYDDDDNDDDDWSRNWRPISHEEERRAKRREGGDLHGDRSKRTSSAPLARSPLPIRGIASLMTTTTKHEIEAEKRMKQAAYADELRSQMGESRRPEPRQRRERRPPPPPKPILKSWDYDDFHEDDFDVEEDDDWLEKWTRRPSRRARSHHYREPASPVQLRRSRVRFEEEDDVEQIERRVPRERKYRNSREEAEEEERGSNTSPWGGESGQQKRGFNKEAYRRELDEQMRRKREAREAEKRKKDEFERKKDEEIANYDPWGKGGAGAPMKTRDGRVVTDLRQMRFENNSKSMGIESGRDSRATSRQADDTNNPSPIRGVKEREEEPQNQYNSHPNPTSNDGSPRDRKLTAQEEYKEYLLKQVEERKAKKEREAEEKRREEERIAKKIEQDLEIMKREYEAEVEKQKRKQDEVRRQNEELKAAAATAAREAKRKAEEEKERERRQVEGEKRNEDQRRGNFTQRAVSPPVPAVAQKISYRNDERGSSPPVPTLRKERIEVEERIEAAPLAPQVSDHHIRHQYQQQRAITNENQVILQQLSLMRQQLQMEQEKLKAQKEKERELLASLDYHRQDPSPKRRDPSDIFEFARSGGKKAIAYRKQDQAILYGGESVRAPAEFNKLKYQSASESRKAFWDTFPDPPGDLDSLDLQQQALLRQQGEEIEQLKRSSSAKSKRSLPGESEYLDIEDEKHEMGPRERRRWKNQQKDNLSLVTTSSFNVDEIAAKNAERLRRLEMITKGEGGPSNGDVLDRFMREHHIQGRGNRDVDLASETSLEAETLLRPGSQV
ncbi:centrosome and spindle pole-associated protein 1-like isoform X3 [Oscarella lobularis]|uniref:centrosome and spindle pole-associated protein 1-like isoform X3 n=1 Tax=Oscarella lobularis TaxID=121494 RepID=UPI003314407C